MRDSNKKEAVLEIMKKRFQEQEFKELEDIEREKTPKETQIIHIVNQATNHLRKRLGLDGFDLPDRNVHIIKEDGWVKKGKEGAKGAFMLEKQLMAIREEPSMLAFLGTCLHEMMHFKSYHARQITSEKDIDKSRSAMTLDDYRMGLECLTRDGKNTYLTNLNGAITEQITVFLFKIISEENPSLFASEAE